MLPDTGSAVQGGRLLATLSVATTLSVLALIAWMMLLEPDGGFCATNSWSVTLSKHEFHGPGSTGIDRTASVEMLTAETVPEIWLGTKTWPDFGSRIVQWG